MSATAQERSDFGGVEPRSELNGLSSNVKIPNVPSTNKFAVQEEGTRAALSTQRPTLMSKSQLSNQTPSQATPSQPRSKILQSMMKKKTMRLGLPTRKLGTPQSNARPKIVIKKLEESPLQVTDCTVSSTDPFRFSHFTSKSLFADEKLFKDEQSLTHSENKIGTPLFVSTNTINNKIGFAKDVKQSLTQPSFIPSCEDQQRASKENGLSQMDLSLNKVTYQNLSGNSSGHSSYTISETKQDITREERNSSRANKSISNDNSVTGDVRTGQPGSQRSALRSLGAIFENDQMSAAGPEDRKRCNSDSGFQETCNAEVSDYQTPFKTHIEQRSADSGLALSLQRAVKTGSTRYKGIRKAVDSVKPDVLSKCIETDLASCQEPVVVEQQKAAFSSRESFKIPAAPAPRFPANEPQSALNPEKENATPRKFAAASPDAGTAKNSANFTPLPKNKELSELIMQRKHASSAAKNNALSTTKKHKIIRIKKERYRVVSLLGRGGSSKVYEVENEDQQKFALKCVWLDDLDDFIFESHINEIQILQNLSGNPNIINLHEWEIKNEVLHMLMEKGDMDLDKFLRINKNMEQDQIKMLWRQMLSAVDTIHKQGIIHTDLKPANFLFVDSSLKLIDFGIAKGLQENCTSTQRDCRIGTLNYMAPESVSEAADDRSNAEEGKKNYKIRRATDIWSLGCILYLMVYGKTPFQHIPNNYLKVLEITSGKDISFPDTMNEDLLDSIKGCLERKPSERYTIEQLLTHPFLTGHPVGYALQESCDMEMVNNRNTSDVLNSIKKSTIDSPNSLLRINKSLAKKNVTTMGEMKMVRKAIF